MKSVWSLVFAISHCDLKHMQAKLLNKMEKMCSKLFTLVSSPIVSPRLQKLPKLVMQKFYAKLSPGYVWKMGHAVQYVIRNMVLSNNGRILLYSNILFPV